MKKTIAALLCLSVLLSLCGCVDAKEIDDTAFILTLGVDKGTEKNYEFSFQLPILAEEDAPEFHTFTCQAEGLSDAVSLLNANTPYRVDFSHLNFFVIGKSLAEEGIEKLIDPLMRLPQMRKGAMVIVSENTAREYANALQSDDATNLMQLQQSVLSEAGTRGLIPYCSLEDLYDALHEQRCCSVVALGARRDPDARPNTGKAISDLPSRSTLDSGLESALLGAAVFDGEKMVGTLNGEQTRAWCMATGQFEDGDLSMENPFEQGLLTLRIKSAGQPKVSVDLSGETPAAAIEVPLEGYVVSYAGEEDYETKIKNNEITPYVEAYLQEKMEEVSSLFAAWGLDGYGVRNCAVTQFKTQQAWENYNWAEKRKQLAVQVKPDLEVLLYRPALGERK